MNDVQPRPYSRDYEFTDAMLGAFRSSGGARFFWTLFGWTTALFSIIYLFALPPIVRAYAGLIAGAFEVDAADPEAAMEAMNASVFAMVPALILLSIGTLVVLAVVRAAFYRRYFHNETGGWFPFRFGGDELRQLLAQLGYWSLFLVFYLLFAIIVGIVFGVVIGATMAATSGEPSGGGLAASFGLLALLYLALIVAIVWYLVTFAPAGALTGLRRTTHVLAARKVTKNRFWPLFGALVVAGIIAYVGAYALMLTGVLTGLGSLLSGDALASLSGDDPQAAFDTLAERTRSGSFRMGALFALIATAAGQAFYTLFLLGPSAFHTREWSEADPTAVFQ